MLNAAYWQGLNQNILTEPACHDGQTSLDSLIYFFILLNQLLKSRKGKPKINPITNVQASEHMQLRQAKLTDMENQRHHKHELCFYCGRIQHQIRMCPVCPKALKGTSKRVYQPSFSNMVSIPNVVEGNVQPPCRGIIQHLTKED